MMKRLILFYLVFSLFLSCGGDDEEENQNDETDAGETDAGLDDDTIHEYLLEFDPFVFDVCTRISECGLLSFGDYLTVDECVKDIEGEFITMMKECSNPVSIKNSQIALMECVKTVDCDEFTVLEDLALGEIPVCESEGLKAQSDLFAYCED